MCGDAIKGRSMRYQTNMCPGCMQVFQDAFEDWIEERTQGMSMLHAPEEVVKFKFLMMTSPAEWFNRF